MLLTVKHLALPGRWQRWTPGQYRRLDEASALPLGQPHDLIAVRRPAVLGGNAGHFRTPAIPVA